MLEPILVFWSAMSTSDTKPAATKAISTNASPSSQSKATPPADRTIALKDQLKDVMVKAALTQYQ